MINYRVKMNPTEIIDNNKEELVESIDVKNTTLWEKLIQLGLFTSSVEEYIKVSRSIIFLNFAQHFETSLLKWQSLSLDYRFLMLILLNHYNLIELVWYLHDNNSRETSAFYCAIR